MRPVQTSSTKGRKISVQYNLLYHELIDEAEIILSANSEDDSALAVIESAKYTEKALVSPGR